MRAAAAHLGRRQEDWDDGSIGILCALPEPMVETGPKRASTFREASLSFIPLRQSHLDFMGAIYGGRTMPPLDCEGCTLVDYFYLPIGVLLVWHEPDGRRWLYAHFGRWVREYPVACLRSIKEVCDSLRAREIFELHCSADESVPGSTKLVERLKGRRTRSEE